MDKKEYQELINKLANLLTHESKNDAAKLIIDFVLDGLSRNYEEANAPFGSYFSTNPFKKPE